MSEFAVYMKETVGPYLASRKEEGFFNSFDGIRLRYKIFRTDKIILDGSVMIAHGFSEFLEKYDEVVYHFLNMGFDVYMVELRGHGYSDRQVSDPEMVHVRSFQDYIGDVHSFVQAKMPRREEGIKRILFAHSMGGGIGANYIGTYPDDFDRVILSAPMVKMRTGSYPWPVAIGLTKIRCRLGKRFKYAAGQTAFPGPKNDPDMSEKQKYFYDLRLTDRRFQTWGASYGWVSAAYDNTRVIAGISHSKVPLLVLVPGVDTMVVPEASIAFAKRQDKARFDFFPDGHHELFNDKDEISSRYWKDITDFIE
ncbi:MAG: alpha/beta hydrolase [Eubacteriales bacterium]|nr:alpha/beta hydrolase [Eubacteriales bacterium]